MSAVKVVAVADEEDGVRLDKWLKNKVPGLGQGQIEKALRKGQIRVDGARAKSNQRLEAGQSVRIPPMEVAEVVEDKPRRPKAGPSSADLAELKSMVIYKDQDVIVLNKPAGLAVQGGTGTQKHIDGMLDGLRFEAKERPRLVHRLDKDTSGILVIARSAKVAAILGEAFRSKEARKLYWAICVGQPKPRDGKINLALSKLPGKAGEKMMPDIENGKRAVSFYRVFETAGKRASWVGLEPRTGRTHQLRVHCNEIGHPILGDGKYGGQEAFLQGEGVSRKLHLHARAISLPHPSGKGTIEVRADLPDHMIASWKFFDFNLENEEADQFFKLPK